MRGFVDDFGDTSEDVLWIQGELHDWRVPVCTLVLPLGSLYLPSDLINWLAEHPVLYNLRDLCILLLRSHGTILQG